MAATLNTGAPERIWVGGTQFVGVPITATTDAGNVLDVTTLAAKLAFVVDGTDAQPGDFVTAVWHKRPDRNGNLQNFADVNVGPGSTAWPVASGAVAVWWQLVYGAETPGGRAGIIQLY